MHKMSPEGVTENHFRNFGFQKVIFFPSESSITMKEYFNIVSSYVSKEKVSILKNASYYVPKN